MKTDEMKLTAIGYHRNGVAGKVYGDPKSPSHITDAGLSVWMWRKGQRVRFLTADGVQVGPEHSNVAPALLSAAHAGWKDTNLPEWMNAAWTAKLRGKARRVR